MPESTCLHIQDRESGPIRVVELPWISVRIGRAAYCEVRLPDEQVADEACRLTRRGRTWSLVPTAGKGPILLDGRPLDGPCPLPFDVPFRMGPYCLTLRHDLAAEPDWEVYPASSPSAELGSSAAASPPRAPHVEAAKPPAGPDRPGLDPDRWRARWKAAEAHLRSRASRIEPGTPRPAYTPPAEALREADRPSPRPPASPTWDVPRPDPAATVAYLQPVPRPSPPDAPGEVASDDPIGTPVAEDRDDPVAEMVIDTATPPASEFDPPLSEMREQPPDEGAHAAEAGSAGPSPSRDTVAPSREGEAPAEPRLPHRESQTPDECLPPDAWRELLPPGVEQGDPETSSGDASGPAGASPSPLPDDADVATEPASSSVADEPAPETARPLDRGPRRRRPRERTAPTRRGIAPRRSRATAGVPAPEDDAEEMSPGPVEAELPTVTDILVNHRNSPGPRPAVDRPRRARQAVPTIPQEPGQWSVPAWLAVPPVGASLLGVGLLGCLLSWWWAAEARTAAIVGHRLMVAEGTARRRPLPPELSPPRGRWIGTTADHLAHWAIYAAGADNDPAHPPSEAPGLVGRALEISPLNPTARLAISQLEGPGGDGPGRVRGLGLSRDSLSLAWSARRLLDAGKKEAALRLYTRALSAAVEGGLSRSSAPRFADDPMNRRYYLPAEDAVRDIVAELASREGLPIREWSAALPRHPTVLLATARLLREQGRGEADTLLDELLGDDEAADRDAPQLLAARAEALGLRSRWKEAAEEYRRAIERVDNDLIRRSWWFNLADIAQRLNDEGQRQSAFRAVLAARSSDDIARRVSEIQRSTAVKPARRSAYGSVRAN